MFVVVYCVVVNDIADMDNDLAFTAVEYGDTEIQIIRALKRYMRISDNSYVALLIRMSPYFK